MKKIYDHLTLKLTSYKITIILSALLLYHFALFINLLKQVNYYNIFDSFIIQFNYFPLFVVYSLGYILIIYNVNQKTNFYKYYYLKFKSKSKVYDINVITLLIIAILFTFLINLVSLAEGIFTLPIENSWSDYFYHIMSGTKDVFFSSNSVQVLTNKITPLTYVLLTDLYSILYFFLEGLLYFVIDSFFYKDGLSLVVVIFINTVNRFLDSLGGFIPNLSFTNNIYFVISTSEMISNYSFILVRILYWFILILVIYIIGKVRTIRSDYKFLD